MKCFKIAWRGSERDAKTAYTALSELIDPPADAVSIGQASKQVWRLDAYFEQPPENFSQFDTLIRQGTKLPPGKIEELPDVDWVATSLEGLGIIRCGRFVLYGIHDADKLDLGADDIAIRIDANLAFGTGHHPTTAGCLTLLSRFAGFAPKSLSLIHI